MVRNDSWAADSCSAGNENSNFHGIHQTSVHLPTLVDSDWLSNGIDIVSPWCNSDTYFEVQGNQLFALLICIMNLITESRIRCIPKQKFRAFLRTFWWNLRRSVHPESERRRTKITSLGKQVPYIVIDITETRVSNDDRVVNCWSGLDRDVISIYVFSLYV